MNNTNQKVRKKSHNTPEACKLILMFIVVLCASVTFTIECFQVKDFFDSTVEVTATVEQIEADQDGCYIKMSYEHDGKAYTDISWYKSDRGYTEGETKEIRILSNTPDVIYTQKTYIRDLYLSSGMFVTSLCALIYEIVNYVKNKEIKD